MQKVTVKLFASLAESSASNIAGQISQQPLSTGDTINSIIEKANLPKEKLHLVILNGTYVEKDQRGERILADGDVLAFWPSIVGG